MSAAEAPVPLLAFADGEPIVFRSLAEARGELEWLDVADGGWEFFTLDGRLVATSGDERRNEIHFQVTDRQELERLQALVAQAHRRRALTSDAADLVAVANELLASQWRDRGPRWPRWLYRTMHRGQPPQIGSPPV